MRSIVRSIIQLDIKKIKKIKKQCNEVSLSFGWLAYSKLL